MRKMTIIAVFSALLPAIPAYAQSMDPQLPPAGPPAAQDPTDQNQLGDQNQPGEDFTGQNFAGVAIVPIEDLPPDIRKQAEAVITETSAKDLQVLQGSIEASPQAKSALAANGLNSSQVVAANISGEGILTLIIQTTA